MCMSRLAQSILVTGLAMKSTVAGLPCDVDVQCQSGYYCASSICLRCYNCTRYFMQATGACSKSITECGSCLSGYVPADNKLEGCTTPKSSTLPYWPALLAAAVAVVLFFGFLARHILTRKRNTDIVHARPALNADDKTNPTAPPPEEYTRLNPPINHEGCRNGYQPTANGNTLETQEDSALLVTPGVSPPPYSTVIDEIRASAHPVAPAARATGDVTVPGHPSQNDLNSTQHNSPGLRDVTGNNRNDTNYISGPSDNVPHLPRQSAFAPNDRPSIHPRTQKGHPKDTRVSRVNETRQRARKFNEPNYDNNEIPENTPASGDQNEAPEWLQDEETMQSVWSPHASTVAAAPSAAIAADTTALSFNISQFHGPDAASEPVRVTTRARTDDDGPPRTRRRLATDNNRVAEVGERTLVIRSPAGAGAAQSPPVSGDDLTPEDGARRPVYSYNVINIQPELSIIAKIK